MSKLVFKVFYERVSIHDWILFLLSQEISNVSVKYKNWQTALNEKTHLFQFIVSKCLVSSLHIFINTTIYVPTRWSLFVIRLQFNQFLQVHSNSQTKHLNSHHINYQFFSRKERLRAKPTCRKQIPFHIKPKQ